MRRLKTNKTEARATADDLWKMACVKKWGQNSIISGKPAQVVHHFFGRNLYPLLRFNLDNGCPLTNGEHFFHHHRGDPTVHQIIIAKRGKKWYDELVIKSKEKAISINTISYYKQNIERLTNYLENKKHPSYEGLAAPPFSALLHL